jgi:hypothetical protein
VIETPDESLEVRKGAAPASAQSDTAFPQADLPSNRAAPIPNEKAHFCDGNHSASATIALGSKA